MSNSRDPSPGSKAPVAETGRVRPCRRLLRPALNRLEHRRTFRVEVSPGGDTETMLDRAQADVLVEGEAVLRRMPTAWMSG